MATLLRITGRVQGVGYRAWFESQALALGLSGWVRNRRDGSVEALIDGDAAGVARIIALARRGPPAARVDDIVQSEANAHADRDFRVLPTA